MPERNYVTEEQLYRHCEMKHGPVDDSIKALFVKIDLLVNKIDATVNKIYVATIVCLLSVVATLVVQVVVGGY
jgi:hypothetical protein